MNKQTTYERIANALLRLQPKLVPIGRLVGGKFLKGHKSMHKTRQSITWRLFWRMKANRNKHKETK